MQKKQHRIYAGLPDCNTVYQAKKGMKYPKKVPPANVKSNLINQSSLATQPLCGLNPDILFLELKTSSSVQTDESNELLTVQFNRWYKKNTTIVIFINPRCCRIPSHMQITIRFSKQVGIKRTLLLIVNLNCRLQMCH